MRAAESHRNEAELSEVRALADLTIDNSKPLDAVVDLVLASVAEAS
jgi:hypothetical protein